MHTVSQCPSPSHASMHVPAHTAQSPKSALQSSLLQSVYRRVVSERAIIVMGVSAGGGGGDENAMHALCLRRIERALGLLASAHEAVEVAASVADHVDGTVAAAAAKIGQ
jgi:hypothetical protein